MEKHFSAWHPWATRNEFSGIRNPGIYILAISRTDISGKKFSFRREIVYIGMTNSLAGLQGRIAQFDRTISGKPARHGGADRFRYKHRDYATLVRSLYVAYWQFPIKRARDEAGALRVMGKVARAEYECFARCVEGLGVLPEFNRKKESLKYSKSVDLGSEKIVRTIRRGRPSRVKQK